VLRPEAFGKIISMPSFHDLENTQKFLTTLKEASLKDLLETANNLQVPGDESIRVIGIAQELASRNPLIGIPVLVKFASQCSDNTVSYTLQNEVWIAVINAIESIVKFHDSNYKDYVHLFLQELEKAKRGAEILRWGRMLAIGKHPEAATALIAKLGDATLNINAFLAVIEMLGTVGGKEAKEALTKLIAEPEKLEGLYLESENQKGEILKGVRQALDRINEQELQEGELAPPEAEVHFPRYKPL
jgi:hypothetical protein